MNKNQRILLIVYAAIILVMLIFPPTIQTQYDIGGEHSSVQLISKSSGGFRFIGGWEDYNISMDFQQLSMQLIVVSLATGALWMVLKNAGAGLCSINSKQKSVVIIWCAVTAILGALASEAALLNPHNTLIRWNPTTGPMIIVWITATLIAAILTRAFSKKNNCSPE